MSLPTIFFSTNTGGNSTHAACIRRVYNAINTPSYRSHFKTIHCVTDNPIEILQQLQAHKNEIYLFHFGGRDEHFQTLLHASLAAGFGSLSQYLGNLPHLDLVFLSYCSRNIFVEPLLHAGIETVVSTSRHLPQERAAGFAAVFYQQYLIYDQTTEMAYNQAITQIDLQPGQSGRQFAGLHGNPQLRARRWWEIEGWKIGPPRIIGTDSTTPSTVESRWTIEPPPVAETPKPHIIGEESSTRASLPPLPKELPLPACPFPGARPYQRADARIFFGRDADLAALYKHLTSPDSRPILVLHGQAGSGKSSLLAAGLRPRLEERYTIIHLYGQQAPRLFTKLCQLVHPPNRAQVNEHFWTPQLAKHKKAVLLVVDQFEAQLGSADTHSQLDLTQLITAIHRLVSQTSIPNGHRVIFCLRTENLSPLINLLTLHQLDQFKHIEKLKGLDTTAIRNVLQCFAPPPQQAAPDLAKHYQFALEPTLADRIATDLTQDRDSSIAPFLQAILASLWRVEKNRNRNLRLLSLQHYEQRYKDGTFFSDFLAERIAQLCWPWPSLFYAHRLLVQLAAHTTWAQTLKNSSLPTKDVSQQLTSRFKDFYLLTEIADNRGNHLRLGHTLLEPALTQQLQRANRFVQWFQQRNADLYADIKALQQAIAAAYTQLVNPSTRPVSGLVTERGEVKTAVGILVIFVSLIALLFVLVFMYPTQWLGVANYTAGAKSTVPSAAPVDLLHRSTIVPATVVNQSIHSLVFSPNAMLFFAGKDAATIERWSLTEAKAYPSLPVYTRSADLLTLNKGGSILLYAGNDGGVGHFRLNIQGNIELLQRHEPTALLWHNGVVTAVEVSADGNWLVTGGQDGTIYLYDMPTKQLQTIRSNPSDPISAVAIDPSKTMVAYAGADYTISLWVRATAGVLQHLAGHTARVNTLEFSRDGAHLLSASSDGTVCRWQLNRETTEYCFTDFTTGVTSAHYALDETIIIAAGNDGFIRIWDTASHTLLTAAEAHPGGVSALAIRADGRQLASAGLDGQIALWDLSLPIRALLQ